MKGEKQSGQMIYMKNQHFQMIGEKWSGQAQMCMSCFQNEHTGFEGEKTLVRWKVNNRLVR
jgi:hypothetical protein